MNTFKINDNIKLEAKTYETSNTWGHKAYLYINDELVDEAKVRYYNRTWERFTFETILNSLIEKTRELTKEQKKEALKVIDNYR